MNYVIFCYIILCSFIAHVLHPFKIPFHKPCPPRNQIRVFHNIFKVTCSCYPLVFDHLFGWKFIKYFLNRNKSHFRVLFLFSNNTSMLFSLQLWHPSRIYQSSRYVKLLYFFFVSAKTVEKWDSAFHHHKKIMKSKYSTRNDKNK